MFLAIAVDNLADAESLSEMEAENEREKERTRSLRRSSTMRADGRMAPVTDQRSSSVSSLNLYVAVTAKHLQIITRSSAVHDMTYYNVSLNPTIAERPHDASFP